MIPPIDAAWNIGVWCRYTRRSLIPTAAAMWCRLRISARCSSNTPLARPVVPPVYISTAASCLVRLLGDDWFTGVDEILVADVVGEVATADQHDVAQRQVGADVGDVARQVVGEHAVDEHDGRAGVGQDVLQLRRRRGAGSVG